MWTRGSSVPDHEDAGIKNPEKYMKDTLCFRQTESVLFSIKHEENKKVNIAYVILKMLADACGNRA